MKRDALQGYRGPGYPTREAGATEVPRHLPKRWRRSRKVAGAMALLFFPLPGALEARADVCPPKAGAARPAGDERRAKDGKAKPLVTVFEHGEGRGAFGCVAVAPPAFLTEADARQVILEEFQKAGVSFKLDQKKMEGVRERRVSVRFEKKPGAKGNRQDDFTMIREEKLGDPLLLDGYDPVRNIGFEFVSEGDYFKVGGVQSSSSVQSYDFKEVADKLAAEARKDGSVRLGVFYDPMAKVDWERDGEGNFREPANDRGRAQLRAQVRDFITWLRAEGVL